MKIYLARPISGSSFEEVSNYYTEAQSTFENWGFSVLHPMTGKSYLRTELKFKAEGYGTPISGNHAILERDLWMVRQSDVVYLDLTGAKLCL